MDADAVINGLIATGKWSREQALLGLRASFRCEYCGRDLLESPDAYRLWQADHIIPIHAGGKDDFDNKVLACSTCNFHFKNRWDPRSIALTAGTRESLLEACRAYIAERRNAVAAELSRFREIIGAGS